MDEVGRLRSLIGPPLLGGLFRILISSTNWKVISYCGRTGTIPRGMGDLRSSLIRGNVPHDGLLCIVSEVELLVFKTAARRTPGLGRLSPVGITCLDMVRGVLGIDS